MNKTIYISILTSLILLINSQKTKGQIIDNDQAHSSVKWRQIDTENFHLLFPSAFENAAKKLAEQLPKIQQKSLKSLRTSPPKITLVLQGNHLMQNGFVQLAPRKSELFAVPSSTADNQEWLPNLALHELRHVAQFDKLTGKMKAPFFEQLAFALYGLNLPAWYFEGDAVQVETMYSEGGRGRLPSWEMPIRANILSGKSYGFNKYVLGSFKDNVPSYYTIGFFMSSYLTNHYGIASHEKILTDMRGKLLRPFNFQRAIKLVSGEKPAGIFDSTISELTKKWEQESPTSSDKPNLPTKNSRYPSDYLLPQMNRDQELYVLKSSPTAVNEIKRLDSLGNETGVVKTGIQITPYFHLRNNEIVWDEYRKHARFGKQTYNVINVYHIETGHTRTLTKASRFYSPAFHPIRDEIVVVEVNPANISRLVILDSKTGEIRDSVAVPNGMHIQQPKYDTSGDKVVAITVTEQGTNLVEFNLITKELDLVLPWGNQQLERPFYYHDNIIFKAHNDGIDNIYLFNKTTGQHKLTDVAFGAFNPAIAANGSLLYNDYQYNGYKLAQKEIALSTTRQTEQIRLPYISPTLNSLQRDSLSNDPPFPIVVKNYNPSKHAINFHSLSISGTNFESFDNYIPGIFWLSNDVLNTTQVKLGYEFDSDISKSRYSAEVSYKRYFPTFTARYMNRGMVGNAVSGNNPNNIMMFDYRDHHATFEMSIPLSVYRRNMVYSYGVNFGTSYTKRYNTSLQLQNFQDVIAFPLNYQVYINRNSMRSKMDLAPRWGQNFSVTFRHRPFTTGSSGEVLSLRTNFYFPGLWTNHSLQLRFAAQKNSGIYLGTYDIPMVSGWGHFNSPIVKNTAMASYRLPLFYPDWSIGSLAYIKRFQGLLFSDFQNVDESLAPKSFGIGLSADLNVFRYVLPDINVSTRLTYINDNTASNKIVPTFGFSYSY
ncbi:hypothetical protein [Sphingobacterium sp. SGR-19]|uniref:hypothetical protein n=1 Tax=Sphingobacterium sp. SGR-19 TaxID=2710886 RepID=UPI0013EE17A2|nr:hypothetical protein [Sphingobacterium sp. SGR-19]NGM66707.1 hypothetical protein [Sphingobacterium sp. SGR-19]